MATQPSEAAGGTSASKPAASKPTAGRQRGAQEMLTAAAVAVAAFLMPSEDASATKITPFLPIFGHPSKYLKI